MIFLEPSSDKRAVMKKETGWAIVGTHGLYIGWWHRRLDAIVGHVHDCRGINDPEPSQFVIGRKLDEVQTAAWERCKARGDRVVKVTISYLP